MPGAGMSKFGIDRHINFPNLVLQAKPPLARVVPCFVVIDCFSSFHEVVSLIKKDLYTIKVS